MKKRCLALCSQPIPWRFTGEPVAGGAVCQDAESSEFCGKPVTVAGWPVTGKTVHDKDGRPMKFMTFEDLTGTCEAVLFPMCTTVIAIY